MPKPFRRGQRYLPRCIAYLLLSLFLLNACGHSTGQGQPPPSELPGGPLVIPVDNPNLGDDSTRPYLDDLKLVPQKAEFFDLINQAIPLHDEELDLLTHNGFVVSERNQWQRFSHAYAWIYWKDLPVLVTTDSILQAVHQ